MLVVNSAQYRRECERRRAGTLPLTATEATILACLRGAAPGLVTPRYVAAVLRRPPGWVDNLHGWMTKLRQRGHEIRRYPEGYQLLSGTPGAAE